MDLYLIEPYNAYCKRKKPKSPLEIAEEEALYYWMLEEAIKQQRTQQDSVEHNLSQQVTQDIHIDEGCGAIVINILEIGTMFRMTEDQTMLRITENGIPRVLE